MGLDLRAYLKPYYDRFRYDFAAIEKKFEDHRQGRKPLTGTDVKLLFHPDTGPFGSYWPEPNEKILDQLSRKPLHLDLPSQDKDDRADLVKRLLGVVHDIGVASVILRFVHPDSFGVFSSPVHALLLVNHMSMLELYLAYCDELIAYKNKFSLSSVAEVEMALTGLYEMMKNGGRDSAAAQRSFQSDIWVQRRRASTVIGPFLRGPGRLELAKILVEEDPPIAAMIARAEYDRRLRYASRKYRQCELTRGQKAANDLLDWLKCKGNITQADQDGLRSAYGTGSEAAHGRVPQVNKVKHMIETIEEVCKEWTTPVET